MNLIDEIKQAWGWIGITPIEIIGENDFGNLIIKDADGRYWRLCPEDCYCEVIAANRAALDILCRDQEFLRDWYMTELVLFAKEKHGELTDGIKFCLSIPGILGGEYGGSNLGTAPLVELVRFSGDIARQIKDMPEGTQVRLKIVD
ncbi:T6SS immunity protein Tdi1 domain-containing protein [Chitinibacter sp. S2-10]|uniref:T6SS immunity protein Tdi1 domain-containing protein n=1 Tax=Chitinibacter sp. S2-10 TaxID=3373597 RepID=UPI0039774B23